jgi:hypothetical protein
MEVLLIRRRQDNAWAVPGQFVANTVPAVLSKALGMTEKTPWRTDIDRQLERHAQPFYTGMMGDPRNTDNAWVVTKAKWYHDDNANRVLSRHELVSFQFSKDSKLRVQAA